MMAKKGSRAKSPSISEGGITIGGNAVIKDSKLVGRDNNEKQILNLSISFSSLYNSIKDRPNTPPEVKENIENSAREIENEIKKKNNIDYSFIAERLRNIKKMAPDIAEIIITTIQSPALGLTAVAKKILAKL